MKDVLETCDTWESSQPSLKYVHNPEYGVPPPKQNEVSSLNIVFNLHLCRDS